MGEKSKYALLCGVIFGCVCLLVICSLYLYYGLKHGPCPLVPSLRLLMALVSGLTMACAISFVIVIGGMKRGFSADASSDKVTACCIVVLFCGAICCILATFIVYIIISANVFPQSKNVQYNNSNDGNYCDYKLFTAAYALTISTWIIFILTGLCASFLVVAMKK